MKKEKWTGHSASKLPCLFYFSVSFGREKNAMLQHKRLSARTIFIPLYRKSPRSATMEFGHPERTSYALAHQSVLQLSSARRNCFCDERDGEHWKTSEVSKTPVSSGFALAA